MLTEWPEGIDSGYEGEGKLDQDNKGAEIRRKRRENS